MEYGGRTLKILEVANYLKFTYYKNTYVLILYGCKIFSCTDLIKFRNQFQTFLTQNASKEHLPN